MSAIRTIKNDLQGAAVIFSLLKENNQKIPQPVEIFDLVTSLWALNDGKFPLFVSLKNDNLCLFAQHGQSVDIKISSVFSR